MEGSCFLTLPQVNLDGLDAERDDRRPLRAKKCLLTAPDSSKTADFRPFDVLLVLSVSSAQRLHPPDAGTFYKKSSLGSSIWGYWQ